MKKIMPYVIALIIGVMICILITPIAKANRRNRQLVGGEILIPVYAIGITAIVRSGKKGENK